MCLGLSIGSEEPGVQVLGSPVGSGVQGGVGLEAGGLQQSSNIPIQVSFLSITALFFII